MKTLKQYTRVERALIRAGRPYMSEQGLEQLHQARRGLVLGTGADGRYYLRRARNNPPQDALRVQLRQRVFLRPSTLIVAESLRSLVEQIADSGNSPAKMMVQAMDSAIYQGILAGNHYAYREKEGLVSYCPNGRTQTISESGKWERAGRQETTPARWVRSVLKPSMVTRLKDHELAEFAEKFRAEEQRHRITLEESRDFKEAYDSKNYPASDGGLFSCMWADPVSSFYEEAPCKVLIARRGDGMLLGRAILWDNVRGTGGARFMDRVYSHTPEVRLLFCEYAQTHGIWKKDKESSACRAWLKPDGTLSHGTLRAEHNDLEAVEYYPYLDTFTRSQGDTLSTSADDDDEYEYCRTDGTREELDTHAGQVQLGNGDWIDEDDACEVDGSWYHQDDCVNCERSQEYILLTDAYRVELGRSNTVYVHENYVSRA